MAALPQSTRRKLSLLHLAQELGNVAKACRLMGYHRDTFYEVRRAFQVGGATSTAKTYLMSGWTSIRDAAGNTFGLKKSIDQGFVAGHGSIPRDPRSLKLRGTRTIALSRSP